MATRNTNTGYLQFQDTIGPGVANRGYMDPAEFLIGLRDLRKKLSVMEIFALRVRTITEKLSLLFVIWGCNGKKI